MAQELILLGAGASMDAGLPDAITATNLILKELVTMGERAEPISQVIQYVVGSLLAHKGRMLANPFDGIDVESVFNALVFLAELEESDAYPFVQSWDSMIAKFDVVGPNRNALDGAVELLHGCLVETDGPPYLTMDAIDFEIAIRSLIKEYRVRAGRGAVFREAANVLKQQMEKLCTIFDTTKFSYLKPVLNPLKLGTQEYLPIITLNYDQGIESICKATNTAYTTGMVPWTETGVLLTDSKGVILLKLHGSVDWRLENVPVSDQTPLPHSRIVLEKGAIDTSIKIGQRYLQEESTFEGPLRNVMAQEERSEHLGKAVIFGHRNKLTPEGPLLDQIFEFRSLLQHAERVTVVGYSFRDAHINHLLTSWINADQKHLVRIISPNFEKNAVGYGKSLINALKRSRRLEIINEKAEAGLVSAFGKYQ